MERFLLLIREDMEKRKKLSEEEFQDCIQRMGLWIEEMAETGNFVAAEPLQPIGRYVNKDSIMSDGPFIEAKEAISGYFIIKAENLAQAAAIAQNCPQVLNNTSVVEVRPIIAIDSK
jgi:hypothetical protein